MNTDHSSLCADTGINDIHLNRLGIVSVNRRLSPYARRVHSNRQYGDSRNELDSGTLPAFDNGLSWYDDDDIKRNKDLLDKERKV